MLTKNELLKKLDNYKKTGCSDKEFLIYQERLFEEYAESLENDNNQINNDLAQLILEHKKSVDSMVDFAISIKTLNPSVYYQILNIVGQNLSYFIDRNWL